MNVKISLDDDSREELLTLWKQGEKSHPSNQAVLAYS